MAPDPSGPGRVELVELLGPRYVLIIRAGAHRLTAVAEAATVSEWAGVPAAGDPVSVQARPGRTHLFDSTGARI